MLVYDLDTLQIDGNTVLAEVMGPTHGLGTGPLAAKQVRGWAYAAGRFVQVSGPTIFPPLPHRRRSDPSHHHRLVDVVISRVVTTQLVKL